MRAFTYVKHMSIACALALSICGSMAVLAGQGSASIRHGIISPNGGEVVSIGTSLLVRWETSSFSADAVLLIETWCIESSTWIVLKSAVANNGECSVVFNSLGTHRVRIRDVSSLVHYESAGYLSVVDKDAVRSLVAVEAYTRKSDDIAVISADRLDSECPTLATKTIDVATYDGRVLAIGTDIDGVRAVCNGAVLVNISDLSTSSRVLLITLR